MKIYNAFLSRSMMSLIKDIIAILFWIVFVGVSALALLYYFGSAA